MDVYNKGKSGASLLIDDKFLAVTTAPSGKLYPYEQGSTGRFTFIDELGRLLVKVANTQCLEIQEDNFDNLLNNSRTNFTLTSDPFPNSFELTWNGIILKEGIENDFILSGKNIITNFIPYEENSLIAKYFKKGE
jgi:hypothetical protein